MVLTKTKENIGKPKITPMQLILFGLLMAWIVLTNLKQFSDLNISVQLSIQIAFYVAIMLTAGVKWNISGLVRIIIGILSNGEADNIKLVKLQNLIVAMSQEVGMIYEQEQDRFFNYLESEAAKLKIKEEIKKLETEA